MRRLIAVAALAALGGCGSGPAPHGISLKIEKSPFRVTVLDNGRTVVAEDKGARLRYQLRLVLDDQDAHGSHSRYQKMNAG
jgi:hypothetical protein